MRLETKVQVTDVAARDGLQSLGRAVPTEKKVQLITALVDAGLRSIEATSFMRPDVVPELADAEALMARVPRDRGVSYRALVPNVRGARRAVEADVDVLVALMTATDSYSLKNQGRPTEQLVDQVIEVLAYGKEHGVPVDVAVGMAFFDPYEGDTPPKRVVDILRRLTEGGAQSVYLATSSGMANPRQVHQLCSAVRDTWPDLQVALHLHQTNGMGIANALAGLLAGVTRFEGSICGIGGGIRMPDGMPGFGNIATEDLVHLFTELGVDCELDLMRVLGAAREVEQLLEVQSTSPATRGAHKAAIRALSAPGIAAQQVRF